MNSLFRKEALDHQRTKLWGDVMIVQPTRHYVLIALFFLAFLAAGLFLASQSYARKESVSGYLEPKAGLAKVYATRGGSIDTLYFKPGDHVTKGDILSSLTTSSRMANGTVSQQAQYWTLRI